MYLAYLINLRGEEKREKREKKEKERKRKKRKEKKRKRGEEGGEEEGKKKKRKKEHSWLGRCWKAKRRAAYTTATGRTSLQHRWVIPCGRGERTWARIHLVYGVCD